MGSSSQIVTFSRILAGMVILHIYSTSMTLATMLVFTLVWTKIAGFIFGFFGLHVGRTFFFKFNMTYMIKTCYFTINLLTLYHLWTLCHLQHYVIYGHYVIYEHRLKFQDFAYFNTNEIFEFNEISPLTIQENNNMNKKTDNFSNWINIF